MRIFVAAVLSVSILFSQNSNAAWNEDALHYSTYGFGQFPGPADTPTGVRGILAALWGGGVREIKVFEDVRPDRFILSNTQSFEKPVTVFLRKQETSRRHASVRDRRETSRKAPLMVFIPGVFGNADHAIAQGMIKWFSRMGYHVLTVPNCWSRDYQLGVPVHRSQYPKDETNAVLELTKWAINEIGEDAVDGVHISGESLGALTAAIVYSADSNTRAPLFTGGATLYWPPIELSASVYALNEMLESTSGVYAEKCHSFLKKMKTKFRIYTGRLLSSPVSDEIECAPSIVAQFSFKRNLMELAQVLLKVAGRKNETPPEDLNFLSFLDLYAPRYKAALNASDRKGELSYWVRETDSSSRRGIQILTSEDDFINADQSWSSIRSAGLERDQLITLPWGGHIGATNHPAFKELLKKQFRR